MYYLRTEAVHCKGAVIPRYLLLGAPGRADRRLCSALPALPSPSPARLSPPLRWFVLHSCAAPTSITLISNVHKYRLVAQCVLCVICSCETVSRADKQPEGGRCPSLGCCLASRRTQPSDLHLQIHLVHTHLSIPPVIRHLQQQETI